LSALIGTKLTICPPGASAPGPATTLYEIRERT
jgi:hypothetical protein